MNLPIPSTRINPLRQRLIDDMTMRRLSSEAQRNYIRDVGRDISWPPSRLDDPSYNRVLR
jgi:hypothetical protein